MNKSYINHHSLLTFGFHVPFKFENANWNNKVYYLHVIHVHECSVLQNIFELNGLDNCFGLQDDIWNNKHPILLYVIYINTGKWPND